MSEATETRHDPIKLEAGETVAGGIALWEVGSDGDPFARLLAGRDIASTRPNAERLALAWNLHDELVAALVETEKWLSPRIGTAATESCLPRLIAVLAKLPQT